MISKLLEGVTQAGLVSYLKARQYDALYWPTFFPLKNVNTLNGKTLIGAEGSRVAGHVISYNAKAPEAGRKAVDFVYFDVPKIAQSRRKSESDILEHEITRALRGNDAVVEDYYNDIDFVFDSVQARMEWYALQALSTTKLQLTTANNPLGIVNETVIDFGMPTANKKTVSVIWSTGNAATMDPMLDFKTVVKAARALGITFSKMLMTSDTYDLMCGAAKFQAFFLNTSLNVTAPMSLQNINMVLGSYNIPTISLIDTSVGIENKAGAITATNPWSTTHITFIPDTRVGDMYNGPIAEQLQRPDGVILSTKGNVSLSIRTESNPVSVLTKAESNVFPSWPTVDKCFSLYTGHASTWA
jgi:hypothetical protein